MTNFAKRKGLQVAGALLLASPGLAFANFTTSVTGVTGSAGGTTGAIVIRFTGNTVSTDAGVDYAYTDNMTAPVPNVTALNGAGCVTAVVGGQRIIRVTSPPSGSPLPAGPTDYCSVTFNIPAGASAGYPVSVTPTGPNGIVCAPAPVTPCTAPNFTVGLATPSYTSSPAVGTINVGSSTVGTPITTPLQVTNTGAAGSTLTVNANPAITGANAAAFSISPTTAQNLAANASVTYTITCTPPATGALTANLALVHNGQAPGATSPANYTLNCTGVTGPTPPTVSLGAATQPGAGPINLTATGSVPLNVDTAGVATASVTVNCSFPTPGPANFSVTGGATRTIDAVAATGPNAPAIAVQCTRQAAAQVATLSCARTTVPASSLPALTVDFTCPAGTTAPNPAVNPASGSTIPFSGPPGATVPGGITFTNTGGTETYNITGCTLGGASPANFAITSPTFPATVGLNGSQAVGLSCTTPANPGAPVTATLTCTTSTQLNPTFTLSCQSLVLAVPAMGMGGKALMILLVLGFGLVGFQLYRRTA